MFSCSMKQGFYILSVCALFFVFACSKPDDATEIIDELTAGSPKDPIGDQIIAAGKLTTDGPVTPEPVLDVTDQPDTTAVQSDLGLSSCVAQQYSAYQVRELTGMMSSDATSNVIFPGAMLQGEYFEDGQFVPITIPKSGGNLILEGLSGSLEKTAYADSYTFGEVTQQISNLLSGPSQATVADFTHSVKEAGSREEFLFNIGLDGRYGLSKIESQLEIARAHEENTVILEFRQVFYKISIENPETMYSMFRDGEDAEDPEDQISAGNPPLYVSSVYYGRQIFFKAVSNHSTEDIKASLEGSYQGLTGSVELESGFTYSEVLNSSEISYIVRGGSAEVASTPINSDDMYQAVLDVITEGATWSQANPGAPIGFDLKYLTTRAPARMAFTADFLRKGCTLNPVPVTQYDVEVTKIVCIDCEPFWENENGSAEFDIDGYISSNRNPNRQHLDLDISGVPLINGEKTYADKKVRLSFEDPRPGDYIKLSAVVTELDNTSNDSFGQKDKTIYLDAFPNGGGFSLYYSIGSGGDNQRVRLWFRITKVPE